MELHGQGHHEIPTTGSTPGYTHDYVLESNQGPQAEITAPGNAPLPEGEETGDVPQSFADTSAIPQGEHESTERHTAPESSLQSNYIDHALAFYGAILDDYAATSPSDPGHAEAAAQWDEANGLMIDYALDMQDLALASQCYGYITNPAHKWAQVAKMSHAGYPLLAEDWRIPLMQRVEQGEYSTRELLAMHKARASMAFDKIAVAREPASQEERSELKDAINNALELLAAKQGSELAPKQRPYNRNAVSDLDPELDVRKHMHDLIKLCADNGAFKTARNIAGRAEYVKRTYLAYGNMDYSLEAGRAIDACTNTLELRELCFGLTADEVLRKSKAWKPDRGYNRSTEAIGALLNDPYAYHTGRDNDVTAAVLFLEEQYPSIQLYRGHDRRYPHYSHQLEVLLKNKEWGAALSHYDDRLSMNKYSEKPRLSGLRNALLVARHDREITTSELVAGAAADTVAIEQLVSNWRAARMHDETYNLPGLRAETSKSLHAYASKTYGLAALQRSMLHRVYIALAEVNPADTTVRGLIEGYVKNRTELIRLLPDYEVTAATELAELEKFKEPIE